MSASAELWDLLDTRTTFTKESWQGNILTNIGCHVFQQETVRVPKKHPFKKLTVSETAKHFNAYCGIAYDDPLVSFLSADNFRYLFAAYGDFIKIFDSTPDDEPILNGVVDDDMLVDTKFILFITCGNIISEEIRAGRHKFEHRVLLCIDGGGSGRNFKGCRFMRYGGKFNSYWKQYKNDDVVSQYRNGSDLRFMQEDDASYYVSLYVRVDPVEDYDKYKVELLKSLGGQGHVICECCQFPIIASPTPRKQKRKCNAWSGDGEYQPCSRKESFVCSNIECNVRCCRMCFKSRPKDQITVLIRHDHVDDSTTTDQADNEGGNDGDDNIDDGNVDQMDPPLDDLNIEDECNQLSSIDIDECAGNDALVQGAAGTDAGMIMNEDLYRHTSCPYDLVYADQDNIFDSSDGINSDAIPTTDAGIFPTEFNQRPGAGIVSGRVLMNVMGSMLKRRNKTLTGTQREQNFVQQLCASSPGTSTSVLFPEASIFTRLFFSCASDDNLTPLGALPLFAISGDSHLGMAPIDDQLRSRVMCPFSTASTDPNHTSYVYDALTNLALNKGDSRIMAVRGLKVSGRKLIPREEDDNDDIFREKMRGDADGYRNVRNLCASMEYIQWSHFYTLTLSHRTHPGIRSKFLWKERQEWLKYHPHYPNIAEGDKRDFINAFEDAYTHQMTPKWLDVTDIILNAIQNQLTHIGASNAIFGRHEYQDSAGELSYN